MSTYWVHVKHKDPTKHLLHGFTAEERIFIKKTGKSFAISGKSATFALATEEDKGSAVAEI